MIKTSRRRLLLRLFATFLRQKRMFKKRKPEKKKKISKKCNYSLDFFFKICYNCNTYFSYPILHRKEWKKILKMEEKPCL